MSIYTPEYHSHVSTRGSNPSFFLVLLLFLFFIFRYEFDVDVDDGVTPDNLLSCIRV